MNQYIIIHEKNCGTLTYLVTTNIDIAGFVQTKPYLPIEFKTIFDKLNIDYRPDENELLEIKKVTSKTSLVIEF